MEIKNNVSLNSIDKAYNVFTTDKNINKETNKKNILERPVNSDINFNLNKIDNNKEVSNNDINALLSSIKSSIENGSNTDIFSESRLGNISSLLK